MGNWNLTIEGVGAHHNIDNPNDANRLAEAVVELLEQHGQSVTHTKFTYGGAEDTLANVRAKD